MDIKLLDGFVVFMSTFCSKALAKQVVLINFSLNNKNKIYYGYLDTYIHLDRRVKENY